MEMMERWAPILLSVLRIVAALIFLEHEDTKAPGVSIGTR
jgi:uncharacterized membrane protein YphA (DoxX/SURF4 family)